VNLTLLAIAALCAVNPARARPALPADDAVIVGALGAALTWLALLPIVALADAALDAAQVASSTLRMGVGVVLVLQGAWTMLTPLPRAEPALDGRRAALVPVAFPVLLTPAVGLLAVAGALDRSAPVTAAVLGAALLLVPIVALVRPSSLRSTVLGGMARLTAAVLVAAGIALVMDGLFDL
jgi:hypothetical protein